MESPKYLDKQGLLYLLQILNKCIENQIVEKIADKAIKDAELEARVVELAKRNVLVTEDELASTLDDLAEQIKQISKDVKAEVKSDVQLTAKTVARQEVADGIANRVAEYLADAIAAKQIISPADADIKYVKKLGDTVTGSLVVNGDVKTEGKFITKNGIVFY